GQGRRAVTSSRASGSREPLAPTAATAWGPCSTTRPASPVTTRAAPAGRARQPRTARSWHRSRTIGVLNPPPRPGVVGPAAKNVQIVTPFRNDRDSNPAASIGRMGGFLGGMMRAVFGGSSAKRAVARPEPPKIESDPPARQEADIKKEVDLKKEAVRKEREELAKIHPGLRTARSVVLHRFGTGEEYTAWRQGIVGFPSF